MCHAPDDNSVTSTVCFSPKNDPVPFFNRNRTRGGHTKRTILTEQINSYFDILCYLFDRIVSVRQCVIGVGRSNRFVPECLPCSPSISKRHLSRILLQCVQIKCTWFFYLRANNFGRS